MRFALAWAAFVWMWVAPLAANAQNAYDLEQLHPQVRAAAIAARAAEQEAQLAANRARDAATEAEDAAQRARSGEDGYGVDAYEGDDQQRHYEGQWGSHGAQGLGVLTFGAGPFKGDRYAGGFSCRHKHGVGVYRYAPMESDQAESRYEGGYDNGRRMGWAVYYTRAGARYVGEFDDEMHGAGVHYSTNGWRYEGQFANSRPNGFGVLWDAQGRVLRAGVFRDARLTRRLGANSRLVNVAEAALEPRPVVRTCAAALAAE